MLQETEFDDGRGRYSDSIRVRTPVGWRPQLKQIAEGEGLSFGEFVRRAIAAQVEALTRRGGKR